MRIEDFKSTKIRSDSGFEAPRHLLPYSKCVYVSPRCLPFLPSVPSQVSQVVKRAASTVRERVADRRRASDRAKWPFAGPRVFLVGVCRCSLSTAFTVIRAFELTIHLRPPFSFSRSFFLWQLAHPQEPLVPSTSVSPRVSCAHTHSQGILPVLVMQLNSARSLSS